MDSFRLMLTILLVAADGNILILDILILKIFTLVLLILII